MRKIDKIKYIRIKTENEDSYSEDIPIGANAQNIDMQNGNNLQDTIGNLDIDNNDNITEQLSSLHNTTNQLDNNKLNKSDVNNYVPPVVTNWLNNNVNPVGSAVTIDKSLTIEGSAADAKVVGDTIGSVYNILNKNGFGSLGLMNADNAMTQKGFVYTDGSYYASDYYKTSDYIRVFESDAINYYHLVGSLNVYTIAFYDNNKVFISGSSLRGTGSWQDGVFTAPSNGYIRFSTDANYITYLQITPPIKDGRIYASNSHLLEGESKTNLKKLSWYNGINNYRLYTNNEVFSETGYLNTSGKEQENANFVRSTYIPVKAGDVFNYSNLWGNVGAVTVVATYNIDQEIIDTIESTGVYQTGSVTIAQNGYIRFSTLKTYVDSGMTSVSKSGNSNFADRFLYGRMSTKGVTADTIGDSITEQYGRDPSLTWQGQIKDQLGLSSIANHGLGGSTVSSLNNGMCTDDRINALTGGTIIIAMGGVNDWAQNVPIGDRIYENVDTTTFFGACNVMFRKLTIKFPASRIVAFGCTFAYYPNRDNFTDKTGLKNNHGLMTTDYSLAMMESAQMNGIEHYDIGGNLTVNRENISNYFNDGTFYVHPNVQGSYMIACFMSKSLS